MRTKNQHWQLGQFTIRPLFSLVGLFQSNADYHTGDFELPGHPVGKTLDQNIYNHEICANLENDAGNLVLGVLQRVANLLSLLRLIEHNQLKTADLFFGGSLPRSPLWIAVLHDRDEFQSLRLYVFFKVGKPKIADTVTSPLQGLGEH